MFHLMIPRVEKMPLTTNVFWSAKYSLISDNERFWILKGT